jgi:hypothetical protein
MAVVDSFYLSDRIMLQSSETTKLADVETLELAQALVERLSINDKNWHRMKGDRKARAREQLAVALMFLLKDHPDEALPRLQQAVGWLDRSISAPPCPTHGTKAN